jgi:hypothetical protein
VTNVVAILNVALGVCGGGAVSEDSVCCHMYFVILIYIYILLTSFCPTVPPLFLLFCFSVCGGRTH